MENNQESKRQSTKRKLENLQDSGIEEDINHILSRVNFSSVEDISDYIEDCSSDDECHEEIIRALNEAVKKSQPDQSNNHASFIKFAKQLEKIIADSEWHLTQSIFEDLAEKISAYSKYGGTKTVLFNNKKLVVSANSASPGTIDTDENVANAYQDLLNTILEYAKQLDQEKDYTIYCCIAKLYQKLAKCDPNQCNQQNAMELANALSEFPIYEDSKESINMTTMEAMEDKFIESGELSAFGFLGMAIGILHTEHISGVC